MGGSHLLSHPITIFIKRPLPYLVATPIFSLKKPSILCIEVTPTFFQMNSFPNLFKLIYPLIHRFIHIFSNLTFLFMIALYCPGFWSTYKIAYLTTIWQIFNVNVRLFKVIQTPKMFLLFIYSIWMLYLTTELHLKHSVLGTAVLSSTLPIKIKLLIFCLCATESKSTGLRKTKTFIRNSNSVFTISLI